MKIAITPLFFCFCLLQFSNAEAGIKPTQATSVSQYGITWTFDKPYTIGRYVTGDYWVLGPVIITNISPAPGPARIRDKIETRSVYGALAMKTDNQMRNGSMVNIKSGPDQGYDSRLINYRPDLSVSFPFTLKPAVSLISTVSNDSMPVVVLHEAIMWATEKKSAMALKTAAILTCVNVVPPANAFRPSYSGGQKTSFTLNDVHWEALPSLAAPAQMPSWKVYERYFQRPWLDHIESWLLQHTGPSENQPCYGREFSRLSSIASLMMMLDVPKEKKEKLMIGYLQLGIDLYGLAINGRDKWPGEGGHWNGRKWTMLFAALVLDNKDMQRTVSNTLFSEDQQTYYGKGWFGQTALYQMVFHTGWQPPYEEKSPDTWSAMDKRSEGYRMVVSGGLPGTALAVQLMKAKAIWNHDAFFDYYDRWMSSPDPYANKRGTEPRPAAEGKALDGFVNAMWKLYRSKVPAQPSGKDNLKWVNEGNNGHFVPNPKL